jgi:N6-adenosine-specific RNA methylase IME4
VVNEPRKERGAQAWWDVFRVGDVWRDDYEWRNGRERTVLVVGVSEGGRFAYVVASPSRRRTRIHASTFQRRFTLLSRGGSTDEGRRMPDRYRTIVADPPWHYDGFATSIGRPHKQDRERGASVRVPVVTQPLPYHSLSVAEIAALPIPALALDDARLFLWTTNRYLPDAFALLSGWRFVYRQIIVWDKTPNLPPFGGSVAPNAGEFLLVATRGAPRRVGKWATSIVRARKGRTEHSRKPDVFLDLVEQVSPGPYLELFARRQRLGWDTWGDEALNHVELSA